MYSSEPYEFFTLYRRAIVGDLEAIDELRQGIANGSLELPSLLDLLYDDALGRE